MSSLWTGTLMLSLWPVLVQLYVALGLPACPRDRQWVGLQQVPSVVHPLSHLEPRPLSGTSPVSALPVLPSPQETLGWGCTNNSVAGTCNGRPLRPPPSSAPHWLCVTGKLLNLSVLPFLGSKMRVNYKSLRSSVPGTRDRDQICIAYYITMSQKAVQVIIFPL